MRKKQKKKQRLGHSTTPLHKALYPNHVWSYDFVYDQTEGGRSLKHLAIVDEFTHEGLMIYLNRSITSADVIRCLSFLFDVYGMPECIKSDYGPEFVAHRVQNWLASQRVKVRYIDPGSP